MVTSATRNSAPRRVRITATVIATLSGLLCPLVGIAGSVAEADTIGPGYSLYGGPPVNRRDPCVTVDYQINVDAAPAGAEADVHEAIRRITEATGIQFRYVGTSTTIPQVSYPMASNLASAKPLLIAWGATNQTDMLSGQAPGVASTGQFWTAEWDDSAGHHPLQIVGGNVVVSTDRTNDILTPGFTAGGRARGPLLMHEIAHTIGLGHTSASGQIMSLDYNRPANWGDGDRAGLQQLGVAAGCMHQRPVGSLDNVTWQQTSASAGTLNVSGWAFDPNVNTSGQVHVYVDGHIAAVVSANGSRADVANAYGRGSPAGFSADITATNAIHSVCVYAISAEGTDNPLIGCADRGNIAPVGALDSLTRIQTSSGAAVTASGWAFDPEGRATVDVHVYVDGQFATKVSAYDTRTDVSNVYGGSGAFGYSASLNLSPGDHNVCTYAIDSTNGPNSLIRCQIIGNRPPVGAVDTVQLFRLSDGRVSLRLAGWSADPDTTYATQVHVYVDGQGVAIADADKSRPDVAAFLGRSQDAYGFDTASPIAAGVHTVCAYSIDTEGGQNTTLGCYRIQV